MYRLQSPQTPLVRTQRYGEYHMDEFPSGTNMIVAVLAYTGAHHLPRCPEVSPKSRDPVGSGMLLCGASQEKQTHILVLSTASLR